MKRAALVLPAGDHRILPSMPVRWLMTAQREGFALSQDWLDFRRGLPVTPTSRDVTFATRDFDTLSAATEFALTFQHSDLELVWTEVADV